ncbi:hypothetical protein CCACVL1_23307 [Corchorus capsularis]|uniref:Uncharacterized protein n=1 Tax=Corchorus capsularis TaxID=210143 RepID=A0A1R3GUP1_COCAP|nr:hypothetical protein CCACVL1_23307 [Corchorus capsularis]
MAEFVRERSGEEDDLLARSTKKIKAVTKGVSMEETDAFMAEVGEESFEKEQVERRKHSFHDKRSIAAPEDSGVTAVEKEKPPSNFGPWILAQTRKQGRITKGKAGLQENVDPNRENRGGSRFAALSDIQENDAGDIKGVESNSKSQDAGKWRQENSGPWGWALKKKILREKKVETKGDENLDEVTLGEAQAQHSNLHVAEPNATRIRRHMPNMVRRQDGRRMITSNAEARNFSEEEHMTDFEHSPITHSQPSNGMTRKPPDDSLGTVVMETQIFDKFNVDPAEQSIENFKDTLPRERFILGAANHPEVSR